MRARAVVVGLLVLTLSSLGQAPVGADHNTASIGGRVTGPDGEPLAGICVELYGELDFFVVTTDQAGSYRKDALYPGEYLVGFNTCEQAVSGHAAEFFDNAAGFTDARSVPLAEGESRSGVDAALEPAATISGRLTDEDGDAPLANDCAVAFDEEQGIFGVARTSGNGNYTIGNLRAGDYLVAFADCTSDFLHISRLYDGTPASSDGDGTAGDPETVSLEDGETASGIDESMLLGGSVTGSVTARHTGQPVDFLCVGLYSSDDAIEDPDGLTFTGFRPDGRAGQGAYVFDGLVPDDYVFGYNLEEPCGPGQDSGYDSGFATGKDQRQDADAIRVDKGRLTIGPDVVLSPRPAISAACPGDRPAQFTDVSRDNVHTVAIGCMFDYRIALGPGDGTYRPAEPVRRGQMATFVAETLLTLGVELQQDPPDRFVDDDESVHSYAIDQIAAQGIVDGKGPGIYAPDETVSRAQMTTFLVRAYTAAMQQQLFEDGDAFADDEGSVHQANINRAATAGLTAGKDSGGFDPDTAVARDQMATFLARLIDRVFRDDVVYDPASVRIVGSPSSSRTATGSNSPESESAGSGLSGAGQLRDAPLDRLVRRIPELAPLDRASRRSG